MSPDKAKVCMVHPMVRPIKKVQIVYYLTRNGQLEHPHFIEVTLLAHQHLRLRDVMERLTALRGKGMLSQFSWSSKRSYKNGYVWNDLTENDIILPAEGAEYVLKGSELVERCSEQFQKLHVSKRVHRQNQDPNLQYSRRLTFAHNQHRDPLQVEVPEVEEEDDLFEEKRSYGSSATPPSRCSRGVITVELDETVRTQKSTPTDLKPDTNSVPAEPEPEPPRHSVLRQLIACGSSTVAREKTVPLKQPAAALNSVVKKSEGLHKGAVFKNAMEAEKVAEETNMIRFMSENPRFGNLQSEEKEYFSGSILESMNEDRAAGEPVLKRSNSFNEERNTTPGLGEPVQKEETREKAMNGKCIPRRKSSSSLKPSIK